MDNHDDAQAGHHTVEHLRPLTVREQVSLPEEQLEEAATAYVSVETGEVFRPARRWTGWGVFGLFSKAACYLWCDAPGHLRAVLTAAWAALGRRRGSHAGPSVAARMSGDQVGG